MIDRLKKRKERFERELSDFQNKLYRTTLFLVKFSFLSIPIYLLIAAGWNPVWLREINASISAAFLNITGLEVSVTGSLIHSPSLLLDVSTDSTGWKSVIALSALIISTETPRNSKMKGIITGTLIILSVNVLRISSMVFLVNVFGISYELLHTVLWRWGLTLTILAYWFYWFTTQN